MKLYHMKICLMALNMGAFTTVFAQQRATCPEPIIYRVFDSLEQHLCKQVDRIIANDYDYIYVVIGPAMNDPKPNSVFRYEVSLKGYTKSELVDSTGIVGCVIRKSNRYLTICGKLYPVYFRYIDQLLVLENPNEPYGTEKNMGMPFIPMMSTGHRDVDFFDKVIVR